MKKISAIILYIISILLFGFYLIIECIPSFTLSTIGRLLLLCSSCLFLYFGGVVLSKKINSKKPLTINLWIFFVLFLILFLTLTLFDPMWGRSGLLIPNWSKEIFDRYIHNSLNIIPFKTIFHYIKNFNSLLPTRIIFYNLIGNVVCLMPLGFFLPMLFPKMRKIKNFLITTILFVLIIELLQFLTLSGSCDIDDIILNVSGAFIMYLLLKNKALHQLLENIFFLEKHKLDKKELFKIGIILILVIVSLFGIIKYREYLYEQNVKKIDFHYHIEIIDETEVCAETLEKFYEDDLYNYYFSCIKSNSVYAKINGEKYLVKDLLNHNPTGYNITIDDLKYAGLEFYKEPKYEMISIEENEEYYYETKLSSSIVELKIPEVIYDENYMKFDIYLIPKEIGTERLKVQFYDRNSNQLEKEQLYSITVDENLNVTYEKVER